MKILGTVNEDSLEPNPDGATIGIPLAGENKVGDAYVAGMYSTPSSPRQPHLFQGAATTQEETDELGITMNVCVKDSDTNDQRA